MPHELGHTRPRPDEEEDLRVRRRNVFSPKERMLLDAMPGEVTRKSVDSVLAPADVDMQSPGYRQRHSPQSAEYPNTIPGGIPPGPEGDLLRAQRRGGELGVAIDPNAFVGPPVPKTPPPPVGKADTVPPSPVVEHDEMMPGENIPGHPNFVGPPAPPAPARTSYGQADIPALVERADQNLNMVPAGAFARPGVGPANGVPNRGDAYYERRKLERLRNQAMTSAPRLQYGQHLGDTPGAGAYDAHTQRLQAGNAADAQLTMMDERDDRLRERQEGGNRVVRDESGNAFFINPVTRQAEPVMTGAGTDAQQLRLPQDARSQQRKPAKVQEYEWIMQNLEVSPEAALQMANTSPTLSRDERILKWARIYARDAFGRTPTPEEAESMRAQATAAVDKQIALKAAMQGRTGVKGDNTEAEVRAMLD